MGGLSSNQFFLDFWKFFNFAKPLRNIQDAYIMLITFDIIIITAFRCVNLVQIKNGSVIINGI